LTTSIVNGELVTPKGEHKADIKLVIGCTLINTLRI